MFAPLSDGLVCSGQYDLHHELTDKGLEQFAEDYRKTVASGDWPVRWLVAVPKTMTAAGFAFLESGYSSLLGANINHHTTFD